MTFPKISAIAIGFFLGFLVPFAAFMLLGELIAPGPGEEAPRLMGLFNVVAFAGALAAPVFAGYLAARIAQVQPLLHGCVVGVLGSILIAVVTSPAIAGLWSAFVFVPGGIAGAWLRKVQRAKSAL